MQTMINILVFVVVLGSIVIIHELGHFIAAKKFGVYCGEFSIGMGPSLWHYKKGETTYHIRALPIGGYVAMAGEVDQEDNENMKDVPFERTIKGIKTWQQVVVMGAGVFMNFILAAAILFGVNVTSGKVILNSNVIDYTVEESTAAAIGLQSGDKIIDLYFVQADKHYPIETLVDFKEAVSPSVTGIDTKDTLVTITIDRAGEIIEKETMMTYDETREAFYLGAGFMTRKMTVSESFNKMLSTVGDMSIMIFKTLGKLVTDSKNTISQLSGPAGIYQVTSQVAESGQVQTLLALIAALSVNVGIFNLLPVPGLDGSQIMFALVEKAMGRPISTNVRYYLQLVGMLLVFGLMIVVTIQDISRMF